MSTITYFCLLISLAFSSRSLAQDNSELSNMFHDDWEARLKADINWELLRAEDNIRMQRVLELLQQDSIITGQDYYHAALIFQHGGDSIASTLAVKCMRRALELDSTVNRWLLAAAIDRDLMYKGKPQIYGTQYVKKSPDAKFERYQMDSLQVSDEERAHYNVESLAEQRNKLRRLNQRSIRDYYFTSNDIDLTVKKIKSEFRKKDKREYNVEENELNAMGYEFMNKNMLHEAEVILQLNTKLYPDSWNTYDSYGEILLKQEKTKQALKQYRKSLSMNPENQNARQILAKGDE